MTLDPVSLFDINGKVAIVTGASGAFGSLASEVLASAGAKLVLAAGNAEELEHVAARCREIGVEVEAVNKRPTERGRLPERSSTPPAARFGRVDILVVGSGKNDVCKIVDMAPERFLDVMDVNVTQSWLMARAAGKRMLAQGQGGKIVLMSSARGLLGHPAGYTAYCASKAAIDGISARARLRMGSDRHHRQRARADGISFDADGVDVRRRREERKKCARAFSHACPRGGSGEPEDLAGPLLFLASRASDFYTGHTLYADGGYTAG